MSKTCTSCEILFVNLQYPHKDPVILLIIHHTVFTKILITSRKNNKREHFLFVDCEWMQENIGRKGVGIPSISSKWGERERQDALEREAIGKWRDEGHSHEALEEVNLLGTRKPCPTTQPQRKGWFTGDRPRHPVHSRRSRYVHIPEPAIHRPSQLLHSNSQGIVDLKLRPSTCNSAECWKTISNLSSFLGV